nr:hypothetical protein [bacterium]
MDALSHARQLLEVLTPLKHDCARHCGGACCKDNPHDSSRGGMLLFPGEEAFYPEGTPGVCILPGGSLYPQGQAPLLVCDGTCNRANRPLACRFFPLIPRPDGRGGADIRLDPRAFLCCPIPSSGLRGMDPAFVDAAREAARLLWADQAQRAFIQRLDGHLRWFSARFSSR